MSDAIAVIGIAARFPGAPTVDDLWDLILDGREGLVRYDDDALARTVARRLRAHPEYVPVGSDLGDIEEFDADAFGMGAHEAAHLDPAHRLFLEQAWLALDAAGYGHGVGVDHVGVYAGTSQNGYLHTNLAHRFDPLGGEDPVSALTCSIGNAPDYLAMGTAYRLGLRGPAVTVQTACSTSLVAVHHAVSALLTGEADLALAGGSTVHVPRGQGYLHVPDGPFSRDGHTRSYGAGATGAVFTQGAGVVVLKRLDDAITDGDRIHAVVRGSAVNNDGPDKAGFTAPSVIGQARVIAEAHAVAGVLPADIGLIEGHGTGTVLGDPIEVRALSSVFGPTDAPWCALGSIKSNIGHTEAAAGVAGFIKAVLAVESAVVPATVHAEEPNPGLGLNGSAFVLAAGDEQWANPSAPRLAGVSSFGFGGTNAHVVIEQPPRAEPVDRDRADRPQIITVTAASARSASAHADRIVESLSANDVRDVAFTLARGRARLAYRTAAVVDPHGVEITDRIAPGKALDGPPAVVFAFPGGGSQYTGMLAETYRTDPESRRLIDRLATEFAALTGHDLRAVCAPAECGLTADDGVRPVQGLPALFVASLVVSRRLAALGVRPDALVGHSLGEYVAAVESGALGLSDAVRVVAARAVALEDVAPGSMLRVRRGADDVDDLLTDHPDLEVAALDAPRSTLLSGPAAAVAAAADRLGDEATVIRVAAAGHSRLVDPACGAVRSAATGLAVAEPTTATFSTATGRLLTGDDVADPDHWVRHMRRTVRFSEALTAAVDHVGAARPVVVVTVGPGASTAAATRAHGFSRVHATLTSLTSDGESSPLRCAAELSVLGVDLPAPRGRRTRLPDYPFDRRRHWIEAADSSDAADRVRWFVDRWTPIPAPAVVAGAPTAVRVIGGGAVATTIASTLAESGRSLDPDSAVLVWPVEAGTDAGHLVRAAREVTDRGERPLIVPVSVGAEIVAPDDEGDPSRCAARGYARVLMQEVPGAAVCAVDLESLDAIPDALAGVVDHRDDASGWTETAVRAGHRYVRTVDQTASIRPASSRSAGSRSARSRPATTGHDAVLIIGGLGRLGAAIGARLADDGVTVVCTTRGPVEERRARAAANHRSGRVDVVRLDPTDATGLADLLRRLRADHARIAVVVAAGVVGAEAFEELGPDDHGDRSDLDDGKVVATGALMAAVDALTVGDRPRTVAVMSSLASLIGGYGLGRYAAVNRIVDATVAARTRRDATTRWLSIQWDGWNTLDTWEPREVSADAFTRRLLADALDPDDAVAALIGALAATGVAAPRGVMAVTGRDLPALYRAGTEETPSPAGSGARSEINGTEMSGAAVNGAGGLADLWAQILDCDTVGPDADFFELGGHSLLATRLLAAVADRYGVTLRLRDLLAEPRLDQMAARIASSEPDPADDRSPIRSADAPTGTSTGGPSFGLTRVQHAYLAGRTETFGTASAACHSYLEFDCGDIDLNRFDAAFNRVLDRHPMLRTVIRGGRHRGITLPPGGFHTTTTDARGQDPEKAAQSWRAGLVTRTASADRWPLVSPHALLTDTGTRIGWSIDVLVCDASSFALLYDELGVAYRGEDLGPAPSTTFADVVGELEERSGTEAYRLSREYWRTRTAELPGPPVVWHDRQDDDRHDDDWGFDRAALTLTASERAALQRWARAQASTESAAVAALYARMLARWSGQTHFSIVTTSFDDRPAGVVGDFTELTVLETRVTDDADGDLRALTAQLFDDLDHRGYSAVDVLADRSRIDGERFVLPVVFTSTLGSGVGATLDWAGPMVFGRSQTPQVYLDHQVYEFGGELILQWDFLSSRIDRTDLDAAVDGLRADLADLVAGGETIRDADRLATVCGAVADVLGVEIADVDPDTGFVAAGGDSVTAVRLVGALRRELGVTVSIGAVVDDATPRELAAVETGAPWGIGGVDLVRADPADPMMDLLPLQQAYWVGQSGAWDISYQSAHFYVDFSDSDADPDRLRQAVARLIAHQPMLRAEVTPDGRQRILDVDDPRLATTPVEIVDLRDAAADAGARAVAATRVEWERTGPDPQTWPAFDVRAHLLPDGGARIHVRCSLVFVDGWSFYLFFAELLAFHDDPNTVLPTPDIGFADYVATVTAFRHSDAWRADLAWWRERLTDLPSAPALPRSVGDTDGESDAMVRRSLRLDADTTAALRARCAANSVTTTAVVGAAYARALAEWAGQGRFLLTMLFFNRLPVHEDIDRVLGPFASSTLVDVRADHDDLGAVVRGFGESIGTVLDHGLVSGVELNREIASRTGRRSVPAPVVFTSTLGFADTARDAAVSRIDPTDVYERVRTPQVLIDCQASEENGSFVCNLDAAGGVFAADDLDGLLVRIGEILETVVTDDDAFDTPLPPLPEPDPDRRTATVDVAEASRPVEATSTVEIPHTVRSAWERATGRRPSDPGEDFFTAGGDSLGMIRMLRAVADAAGVDVEPASFLADPTPSRLASLVPPPAAPVGGRPRIDSSALVPLTDGRRTPLYLIHPSGGDVLCYVALARAVHDRPVVAVCDPALIGDDRANELTSIPLLAAAYADAIARHAGTGDVVVGGWSMGGTLAHEVAAILAADPAFDAVTPVGVVMIDSTVPDRIRALPGAERREQAAAATLRYLGSLEAFLDVDLRSSDPATAAALTDAGPAGHGDVVSALLARADLSAVDVERKLAVFHRHLEGLGEHTARRFDDAPVLLVRALERAPRNSGIGMGVDDAVDLPDLGWRDRTGDLRRRDVAAHHYSLLDAPAVDAVADLVDGFLDEVAEGGRP